VCLLQVNNSCPNTLFGFRPSKLLGLHVNSFILTMQEMELQDDGVPLEHQLEAMVKKCASCPTRHTTGFHVSPCSLF
jgi:hypothetical protein